MRPPFRVLLAAQLFAASLPLLAAGVNDTVQSTIPEVVTSGNAIQLIKEGLEGSEGPLPLKDGTVLMTENRAGRILQIAANGAISLWADNTASGGANALALNPQGEVVATMTAPAGVGIVTPGAAPKVLVKDYQGNAFNRPNDLIVSKRGTIYFTDPAGAAAAGAPAKPSSVFMLGTDGTLTLVSGEMTRPNGIALSPDERTLYVADTASEWLMAFSLDKEGKPGKGRKFGRLDKPTKPLEAGGAGADGLAVDEKGRVYVATALGVQVLSARGELMGIISTPVAPQNLAFGGSNRSMLHVVGRGNVYVIGMETRGPRRDGK